MLKKQDLAAAVTSTAFLNLSFLKAIFFTVAIISDEKLREPILWRGFVGVGFEFGIESRCQKLQAVDHHRLWFDQANTDIECHSDKILFFVNLLPKPNAKKNKVN